MQKEHHVQRMPPPRREVVGVQGTGRMSPRLKWREEGQGYGAQGEADLITWAEHGKACKSSGKPLSCLDLGVAWSDLSFQKMPVAAS